jgi:1,4-alpha-glucan branching enzyme
MLKKQYAKNNKDCKVTFYTNQEIKAETVHLVGDFNDWNETSHPMEALKDGRFKLTITLDPNKEYQFRYLINKTEWHNDWDADKYAPNPYGGDNSIVTV